MVTYFLGFIEMVVKIIVYTYSIVLENLYYRINLFSLSVFTVLLRLYMTNASVNRFGDGDHSPTRSEVAT